MAVEVFTRDAALRRTGQLEDVPSLTTVLRFNAPSSWQITVDGDTDAADLLAAADGVLIVRDGGTQLSGSASSWQRKVEGDRSTLTVTGLDDTVWLRRALALPVPTGPPYTAVDYDDRSGPAETVLRYFVDRNLGPSAPVGRRLPYLTLPADLARGTSVRGRGRFHTLLELLQPLALAGGDLGFKIVQVGTGLEFQVYQPADRSATAVFSLDLGNLSGYDYTRTLSEADYVIVGGGGEGTARTFVEGGDAAAISARPRRSEVFRDRRDTTDVPTLEQTRAETLAENKAPTALSLTPVDTDAVTYGIHYGLGDRVTVRVDGVSIVDVVREVTLTLTAAQGEELKPVVGSPGASGPDVPDLFPRLRRQAARVSNLERR